MIRNAAFILIFLFFINTSYAIDIKFSGTLETYGNAYLKEKADTEDAYTEIRFLPKATYAPTEDLLIHMEGDFRVDTNNYAQGYIDDVIERSNRWIANMREGYIEYTTDLISIRAGKQVFNWCITDTVCPNDNLNARDYNDIIRWERVGVMAFDIKYGGDTFIEAVVLPWLTPSRLPKIGTRWERELAAGIVNSNDQDFNRNNAQFALRAGTTTKGYDLGLSFYKGYSYSSSFKLVQVSSVLSRLEPTYRPEEVYAISVAKNIGKYNCRAEVGYFRQDNEDNFLQYVIGVDREWSDLIRPTDSLYMLIQYVDESITKQDNPVPFSTIDFRRVFNNAIMAKLRYSPNDRNRWSYNIEGSYNLSQDDFYFQPSISYKQDRYVLKGGIDIMGGPSESFFGGYSKNNRAFVMIDFFF